jgi:uncharacterized protein (TIGR03437 family)
MTRLYVTILLLGSALCIAVVPVQAQSFDTSGTANLTGKYLFRYVNFFNDENGNLTESCSLTGAMVFDGAGHYTLSNTQLFDSLGTTGTGDCASLGGGTYGVQSNGMAQLDNPLYAATLYGTFSQPVVIASSTEDDYFDLFIAVQAPATSSTNASLSGIFTVGTLDFLNSSASLARQGYFALNADGHGNIAPFMVTGSLENVNSGATVTQSVSASTYALSGTAGGSMTFPGSSDDQTEIVSGAKVLYVSADGDWFVGGSATGSDMFFGFRAPHGISSNSLLSGTYFMAGMEDYEGFPPDFLDAFYGSVNTNGNGTLLWHQRFDDVVDIVTYDNTFNSSIALGANGSYYDGAIYTYLAGSNGRALMLIGSNQQFSLIVGIQAPSITPGSSVWINPIGITNAANYTPITNSYAPGELVTLYGTFGVSTQVNGALPVPTKLDGVQVFVNGIAAPVHLVSQNQISALIPYEISGDSFATFQVVVNGSKSNLVTVYAGNSAPGIYTADENGVGDAAILHSDYSLITNSSPAKPGETVLMYLTGLGAVTPQLADGEAAPGSPLSVSVEAADTLVALDDGVDPLALADISFAGLAPGFAGLYQVNFTVPSSGLTDGYVLIIFATVEAQNYMSTISLSGFSQSSDIVPSRRASRPRSRPVAAGATFGRHAKKFRRGLPERSRPVSGN